MGIKILILILILRGGDSCHQQHCLLTNKTRLSLMVLMLKVQIVTYIDSKKQIKIEIEVQIKIS